MSHPYRISVSHSTTDTVCGEDYTQSKIDLTPILPEDQMKDLLEKVLEEKGWTREKDENVWSKKGEEGERMEINVDELVFTTYIEVEGTISKEKTVSATGDSWNSKDLDADRKRLEERVKQNLAKELEITDAERDKKKEELADKASQTLREGEEDRNRILNEILVDTYADALQEKAKTMGEVTEISESKNENEYELIIKIKA